MKKQKIAQVSRLKPYALGNALGLLGVIIILSYAVLVWFGGYDYSYVVGKYPINFVFDDWTFLFGVLQTFVLGYIFGWIFARIYNHFI